MNSKITLYQIENEKSGRRVKHTPKGYKWGCDCGKDGSFFTIDELSKVSDAMDINLDIEGILEYSEYSLHEYEIETNFRPVKKKSKVKTYKECLEDDDDLI